MEKNFVKDFDPANDKAKGFENLTLDEIKQLAAAYPNQGNQDAYLVLRDTSKSEKQQLYPLSTWSNLLDLHKAGQTQFVAAGFKSSFNRAKAGTVPTAPVQDLTKEQAKSSEGLVQPNTNGQQANSGDQGTNNSGDQGGNVNDEVSAPLEKWELEDLRAKYEIVTGKKAGRVSKDNLIKAIKKADKK